MNIYSVIHHVVDKLPARDETHLRDLHDTITAHELGYSSLEELNEERRLQAVRIDPAAAAAAWEAAQTLLMQVKQSQDQITKLLQTAEEGRKAQAAQATEAGSQQVAQSAPATPATAFPQPVRTPADGPAPAVPIAGEETSTPEAAAAAAPSGPSIADLEAQLAAARAAQGGGA